MRRRQVLGGLGAALALGGAAAWAATRRDRFDGGALDPRTAYAAALSRELVLVDIRRPAEWAETGVPGPAHRIDVRRDDFLDAVAAALDGERDRAVALICARGVRSDRAAARLAADGFSAVHDVSEGVLGSSAGPGWIARGLPVRFP